MIKSKAQWPRGPLIFFYLVLLIIFSLLTAKLFVPSMQMRFIQHFHHTQLTYIEWAVQQFVPWMYNSANEIWISEEPISPETILEGTPPGVYHRWVNHHPMRYITFALYRDIFFKGKQPKYFMIRSQYQGKVISTWYQLRRDGKRLVIDRLGEEETMP